MRDFPGALRTTTSTLGKVDRFAKVLRTDRRQAAPGGARAQHGEPGGAPVRARGGADHPHNKIRPFVRAVRPLVRDLKQPARQLAKATPDLTRSFVVLNHLFDLFSYNQNGREGPGVANRDEGYLFWIAWVTHQTEHLFTTNDAIGSLPPVSSWAAPATRSPQPRHDLDRRRRPRPEPAQLCPPGGACS